MPSEATARRLPFFRHRSARPVRILSIDGGGIRGIIPAMVLADIERRTGRRISELFDFVTGTSTGGLLALALTLPGQEGQPRCTAYDLVRLYESEGEQVFSRTLWHKVRALGNLVDGKYPIAGIEKVLATYFGEALLSGMIRAGWSPADLLCTARRPERAAIRRPGGADAARPVVGRRSARLPLSRAPHPAG